MPTKPPDRPDYARFARQIALPEVGPAGQNAVTDTPVTFHGDPAAVALAEAVHSRAGGLCGPGNGLPVLVPLPRVGESPAALLGVAAAGAVEAARRVLGERPAEIPAALLARLGGGAG